MPFLKRAQRRNVSSICQLDLSVGWETLPLRDIAVKLLTSGGKMLHELLLRKYSQKKNHSIGTRRVNVHNMQEGINW